MKSHFEWKCINKFKNIIYSAFFFKMARKIQNRELTYFILSNMKKEKKKCIAQSIELHICRVQMKHLPATCFI